MANSTYRFDRFLRYDEMAAWLRATAAAHPNLMSVESYGKSHDGRDLLVATITDASTGTHDSKPAHWVDANIHAIEVTGGVAALHLIHYLVTGVGNDPTITEARAAAEAEHQDGEDQQRQQPVRQDAAGDVEPSERGSGRVDAGTSDSGRVRIVVADHQAIDRGGVEIEYRWIAGSAHASSKKSASDFDQGRSVAAPSDNVTRRRRRTLRGSGSGRPGGAPRAIGP